MREGILSLIIAASICFSQPLLAQNNEQHTKEETFINLIEVKKINLDFKGKNKKSIARILWDTFANKPHQEQFDKVSTKDWFAKWKSYKVKLIAEAERLGFDKQTLSLSLNKIEPDENSEIALLPIAAYLAKLGQADVWIIVCKLGIF